MESPYAQVVGELDRPTGQHRIGFGTMESHQFYEPDDPDIGSFKIEFGNVAGPTITDLALVQQTPLEDLLDVARNPMDRETVGQLARNLKPIEWGDDLLDRIDDGYGNHFEVSAEIEVLPRAENRVTLSDSKVDEFGNPVPEISWNRGPRAVRTSERAFEVLNRIVDALDAEVEWTREGILWRGVGHHSGTTRMGDDPTESVVDATCRTHDIENLYLAGCNTFPTSGAMQPTLTIAALALRLADTLAERL